MPGIELAALCTRRPQRLAEVADRFQVAKRYTDYRDLLADPDIDVVGVITHINDHRDIAIDALRSGKHVFFEKPMRRPWPIATGFWRRPSRRPAISWSAHLPLRSPRGLG